MPTISCIIPAHNEAPRIGHVLSVATQIPELSEVLVIDDASTDETSAVVARFPQVRYYHHETNQGKSKAIATGIAHASGDYILMLDADLVSLTVDHVESLISPIVAGTADVAMSLRGNSPGVWRAIGLDYLSGERILPRHFFEEAVLNQLPRFGLEVFLNKQIIEKKYRIKIVSWTDVESPLKYKKYGLKKGVAGDVAMMRDIFQTVSFRESLTQIVSLARLRV